MLNGQIVALGRDCQEPVSVILDIDRQVDVTPALAVRLTS